jgi:hypothetical protein
MAFLIVLMIAVALAVLFIGLRYVEASERRKELQRRWRANLPEREDKDRKQ